MSDHSKVYLADRYTNRISHRALTAFERRNPATLEIRYTQHATWQAAHEWIVAYREAKVAKAERDLANAKDRLKRAKAIQQKGGANA